MRRRRVALFSGIPVVAFIALGAWWWLKPEPKTHYELFKKAFYAQPVDVSEQLLPGLQIMIDGEDWMRTTPVLACGSTIRVVPKIPKLAIDFRKFRAMLLIVPRPAGGTEEDFHWFQIGSTLRTGLHSYMIHPIPIRLIAGKYRVRFYLQLRPADIESGAMPIVHYLGERKLIVTPPEDGSECGEPLPKAGDPGTWPAKTESSQL